MGFDYRTSIGLGNRLLEDTNKTFCVPGARRKEQRPHKRLSQTCLWASRSLPGGGMDQSGLWLGLGRWLQQWCVSPFEGGLPPYHGLASGQTTGRGHSPTHQHEIRLKIYWAWPLDCKEIQPVHPKGNQSWILIGRTDIEAETPILWPPDAKNWLIWKDPNAGKDWRQEEKGTDRGWDGWMASPMQWTWVWVSSGSWWWTGGPGVLQSMGSQRVRQNWATELNWAWPHPLEPDYQEPDYPTASLSHQEASTSLFSLSIRGQTK